MMIATQVLKRFRFYFGVKLLFSGNRFEQIPDELCCTISKRFLASWKQPDSELTSDGGNYEQLHLLNSLTRKKELFIPTNGRQVSWYICGPTVYDSAHMGHARTYIAFDIVRRILQNYFGYNVTFVMNITDMDDKIIKRARQQCLLERYLHSREDYQKIIDDVLAAVKLLKGRYDAEQDSDKKTAFETVIVTINASIQKLQKDLVGNDAQLVEASKNVLLEHARDVLSEWLDIQQQNDTSFVDNNVFKKFARKYESEFYSDMKSLNVLPADILTRVSEYVPEIIDFIKKIIQNGYAYESNGSVYFDVCKFSQSSDHRYAKLLPEAFLDPLKTYNEEDGEVQNQGKANVRDFALWKASRSGEPFWSSPWGNGRPGWHVECSVMATSIFGPALDIHSGGSDLKFPHHDNELAQTEAHYRRDRWVNYFLHAGTLNISGLKMSKSLRNFITVKDVLKQYTARQLRLLFLFYNWSDSLEYSPAKMLDVLDFEKACNEFFMATKYYSRKHLAIDQLTSTTFIKFENDEKALNEKLAQSQIRVHQALCDSLDTQSCMEAFKDLISSVNVYTVRKITNNKPVNVVLLRNIAFYVSKMLHIFGVCENADAYDNAIGFELEKSSDASSSPVGDKHDLVMPYVQALADFRERIRSVAIDDKLDRILVECDRLRNETLPELGVRLEDRGDHTMVKFCDAKTVAEERVQRLKAVEERKRRAAERAAKKAEFEAKRRVPPNELFSSEIDKYSKFDDKGIPTHGSDGKELSKRDRKRLQKVYNFHKRKYKETLLPTDR